MTKKTIKVIKREDRNRKQAGEKAKNARKTPQETARDMVGTVSNWVNEFQQKRRTETTRALQTIKTLFPEPTQPNEA